MTTVWCVVSLGCPFTAGYIEHHQQFAPAVKETMRLLEEIDEAIEKLEGWPIG